MSSCERSQPVAELTAVDLPQQVPKNHFADLLRLTLLRIRARPFGKFNSNNITTLKSQPLTALIAKDPTFPTYPAGRSDFSDFYKQPPQEIIEIAKVNPRSLGFYMQLDICEL